MVNIDINKRYTFADYLTWLDDKRRELFNGFVKLMTPAPSSFHQDISGELLTIFRTYSKKKKCKVFHAPFDVRLTNEDTKEDNKINTVVQPDISIICDLSKIDKKGCLGPPDMIIEIVSENAKRDLEDKFKIYEQYGVKEYWIVYPYERAISVFVLKNKKFKMQGMFAENGQVKVNIFDDLYIDIEDVFSDILF